MKALFALLSLTLAASAAHAEMFRGVTGYDLPKNGKIIFSNENSATIEYPKNQRATQLCDNIAKGFTAAGMPITWRSGKTYKEAEIGIEQESETTIVIVCETGTDVITVDMSTEIECEG